MTRALTLGVALLLLAGAGFVGLLAGDVRHWEERLVRDDLSFRETPNRPDLFQRHERIPAVARRLLAIDDDLAFRQALQLVVMSVAVRPPEQDAEADSLREAAEIALAKLARADPDRSRRSEATNLLGVLSVSRVGEEPGEVQGSRLDSAIVSFRSAVLLDARNERAKYNLELALQSRDPEDDMSLPRGVGGKGALGREGSGY